MTAPRMPFEYALLRVVPRIERGESMNAGVIVYCRSADFLGARVHLDGDRLRALDPSADVGSITAVLDSAAAICSSEGDGRATSEQIGRRFRWLTAPRSTVVQTGPVHTGLTTDPAAEVERLLAMLVLSVAP